ncbi:Rhs element Vgr protein, subgroup, partial [Candidatus Magnetomorum sp. HK-1]
MRLTQDGRKISIHTPMGKDKLILMCLSGEEYISDIFSFELTMISEDHQIAFKDIIGKNVTISIKLLDNKWRYINGIISRFSQGKEIKSEKSNKPLYACYFATVVPQLWLLNKSINSKIFQEKTVDEIIVDVLEKKIDQIETQLKTYPIKEYYVQYQESDFNFVSRLMEEYGIYYYFKHEKNQHIMVITDSNKTHSSCPNQPFARYAITEKGIRESDFITQIEKIQEIQPSNCTFRDYNFEKPTSDLTVESTSEDILGNGNIEVYNYPGRSQNTDTGEKLVNICMEAYDTEITTIK